MADSVLSIIHDFADRAMAQMNKRVTHCWLPAWQWEGLLAEARGLRPWRLVPAGAMAESDDAKSLIVYTQTSSIIVEQAQHPYPTIAWAFEEKYG